MAGAAAAVAKDHEIFRMLVATYLMAWAAGFVDAVTYLSVTTDNDFTTHVSGTAIKAWVYLAKDHAHEKDDDGDVPSPKSWQFFLLIFSFFVGSLCSGMLTRRGELKTLKLLANVFAVVGAILILVAVLMVLDAADMLSEDIQQNGAGAKYLCLFAMGLQNSILTCITGFARTTHVTGTVTDIGLLVGQGLDPDVRKKPEHWAKCKALSILLGMFMIGGLMGFLAYDEHFIDMKEYSMFVPAAVALVLAAVGRQQLWSDARKVAVEETVAAQDAADRQQDEAAKLEAERLRVRLRSVSRSTMAMGTLLADLRAEIPTIDNMPNLSASKAVAVVIKTNSARSKFMEKLKSKSKEVLEAKEVSNYDLVSLFALMMKHPELMEEIKQQDPNMALHVEVCSYRAELRDEEAETVINGACLLREEAKAHCAIPPARRAREV